MNLRQHLAALALVLALTACVSDDTDFGSIINDISKEDVTPIDISLDFSALDEADGIYVIIYSNQM